MQPGVDLVRPRDRHYLKTVHGVDPMYPMRLHAYHPTHMTTVTTVALIATGMKPELTGTIFLLETPLIIQDPMIVTMKLNYFLTPASVSLNHCIMVWNFLIHSLISSIKYSLTMDTMV